MLPTYTTSQQQSCPTNQIQVSTSNTAVASHSGLNEPVLEGVDKSVKPADTSLHQPYTFYTKVSAQGGSTAFFGPYTLNIGCFTGVVTFADHSSLVTTVDKWVGDSTSTVYTFNLPTSTLSFCDVQTNSLVNLDGSTYTTGLLIGTGAQP